jgi:hypothetical protein
MQQSQGFELIRSQFNANNMFVFFGGLWFSDNPEDKANFDPSVPWVGLRFARP